MGICHFNTSDISQLALPMTDVDVSSWVQLRAKVTPSLHHKYSKKGETWSSY